MTLAEIAEVVSGAVVDADPDAVVRGPVEFDSRKVRPGCLFLALPGERVDGHDYAQQAVADGAVAVLATRPVPAPHVLVADGIAALTALASHVARRLDARIVGITGSSGKTSTKDLVAQLLERLGPTVAPPGSFNNELGHPYTVLLADESTRYLVLEVSARGIGHIAHLTRVAPPDIGVVLNVGSAHLGEFGDRAAIAQAKGELVEALTADGVAVLNADDPLVEGMAARTVAPVLRFGQDPRADVRAEQPAMDDRGRARFTLVTGSGRAEVALQLVGGHHVSNALAAASVALQCGMPLPDVAAALSAAGPRSRWRMEVTDRPDGVTVINDAYNANPESMRAGLDALVAVAGRHRRSFAVLGGMAELGDDSEQEHRSVGQAVARLGIARLIAVGEAARPLADGADLEGSWAGRSGWVPDADAALELIRRELAPGDVVLVKASRSVGLEVLADALTDDVLVSGGGTA